MPVIITKKPGVIMPRFSQLSAFFFFTIQKYT